VNKAFQRVMDIAAADTIIMVLVGLGSIVVSVVLGMILQDLMEKRNEDSL